MLSLSAVAFVRLPRGSNFPSLCRYLRVFLFSFSLFVCLSYVLPLQRRRSTNFLLPSPEFIGVSSVYRRCCSLNSLFFRFQVRLVPFFLAKSLSRFLHQSFVFFTLNPLPPLSPHTHTYMIPSFLRFLLPPHRHADTYTSKKMKEAPQSTSGRLAFAGWRRASHSAGP